MNDLFVSRAGRFEITAQPRPDQIDFVPGAPRQEVLAWSIRIFDLDGPLPSLERRELSVITRHRAEAVELLRVLDVLLAVGIRVSSPAVHDGNTYRLVGEVAAEAWPPLWADDQSDPLDRAKPSWLADYDYDESEPGVPIFHTRAMLPQSAIPAYLGPAEQPSIQVTQTGWASGGLVIYERPSVLINVPGVELSDPSGIAQFASALGDAATAQRELLATGGVS